jgi:hypothetical protein
MDVKKRLNRHAVNEPFANSFKKKTFGQPFSIFKRQIFTVMHILV